MAPIKLIVVGGVAAGASAAAKARRCNEEARIVVLDKGPFISYATCGLPYYLSGVINDRRRLLVTDPKFFRERFDIEVRVRHEVMAIVPVTKTVTVREVETGRTYEEPYDKLVLAPGALPVVPAIPGVDLPFVFTLKTLEDCDRVFAYLHENKPRRAVIVGCGLIGMETMENLVMAGLEVAMVEHNTQVLPFLDFEMAEIAAAEVRRHGVALYFGEKVAAIGTEKGERPDGGSVAGTTGWVTTDTGRRLPADLVILAIGIRPNVALAKTAGLAIGSRGGIVVDDGMRTNVPDIYAAGDCVESVQLVTGNPALVPMGAAANKQGRAAGANAMGRDIRVAGFAGTVILKVFDLTVAKTGLSEKAAQVEGITAAVTYVFDNHHAGYYPGAKPLRLKTIADSVTGRLLGAQIIGEEGVDKRIDVMATALYARMHAEDLIQLDLAYAPPYSAARDPVIVAGALHQNLAAGDWQPITPQGLWDKISKGDDFTLIDVRTAGELRRGGIIPGAIHIPLDELRRQLDRLNPGRETILYCAVGLRSYVGSRILAMKGFAHVKTLTGGISGWIYTREEMK